MRHPRIELFNNSAGTVDLGGCFLTNDKNNPTKYMIPKGDVLTKIPPYQHTLFWADDMKDRGTFHLNFTLEPDKDNYIALYDSDGKTLIDEITIPAGQKADVYVVQTIKNNAVRIPNASFYTGPGVYELFVEEESDNLVKRKVNLGECDFDHVEVVEGLRPGEQAVISDMSAYGKNPMLKIK